MTDSEFLVWFEPRRMSGLWGVLMAPSSDAILAQYPELSIADEPPPWMSGDELARLRSQPVWLDDDRPRVFST